MMNKKLSSCLLGALLVCSMSSYASFNVTYQINSNPQISSGNNNNNWWLLISNTYCHSKLEAAFGFCSHKKTKYVNYQAQFHNNSWLDVNPPFSTKSQSVTNQTPKKVAIEGESYYYVHTRVAAHYGTGNDSKNHYCNHGHVVSKNMTVYVSSSNSNASVTC